MPAEVRNSAEHVLDRLEGVKERNGGFEALCPAHDDHGLSLSVGSGRDGRVLIECHAGCTQREILDALERRGIPRSELFEWSEASPKGEAPNHPALKTRSHEAVRLIEEWDASPVWRTPALRGLINAAKLLEEELPPVRWAVPDLVPEGVTLLAGKPKTGKSWLALGLCIATASGGLALGAKRVEEGSTLYLALEDNKPRLQRRLRELGAEGHRVRGLGMATRWPRIGKGCEEALEEWLAYSPDARLVVIDTLAKIRPPASGNNPYAEDYRALEPLLPIAARHNVAIVVVHHLRKAGADDPLDEISGSTGLSGGTDGALIRKRDRGRADAYVYVTGRDIEEEKEYALRWGQDVPGWTLVGTADEYKATQEQREVLDLLMATGEPMSPSRVSEELASKGIERRPDACRKLLGNLVRDDLATSPGHGKYASVAPNAPSAPNDAGPDNSPDHLGKDATSVTDAKVLDLQVKRSERSVRSDDTWTDPHDRDRAV